MDGGSSPVGGGWRPANGAAASRGGDAARATAVRGCARWDGGVRDYGESSRHDSPAEREISKRRRHGGKMKCT